ncbi:hypothetical protein OE88DRAFT_1657339 [Heliocybe sulcata]|uniref:Uncharacterized protein n=1 Tax=Heliocybe sulcata TaxID=5364 RepID=A0A5C3N3L9_9AGAM|nr:hypothetical protein OE88DRAFT_1657339 [Heliocybe sulcata]
MTGHSRSCWTSFLSILCCRLRPGDREDGNQQGSADPGEQADGNRMQYMDRSSTLWNEERPGIRPPSCGEVPRSNNRHPIVDADTGQNYSPLMAPRTTSDELSTSGFGAHRDKVSHTYSAESLM